MSNPSGPQNPTNADGTVLKCGLCQFYVGGDLGGQCRHSPPTTLILGVKHNLAGEVEPNLGAAWPGVGFGNWCWSFRPKEIAMMPLIPHGDPPPLILSDTPTEGAA